MQRRAFLRNAAGSLGAAALLPAARALALDSTSSPVRLNPVHLNQAGYSTGRAKYATVNAQAAQFTIRPAAGGASAFQAALSEARSDAASGDTIRIADFSGFSRAGLWRLALDNGEVSPAFPIGPRPYHDALRLTMRAYYGQRCGCNVNLGGGYHYPACHLRGAWHPSSGKSGAVTNHGGWHDAGDYGRYVVNSAITVGTLLWAWELYTPQLRTLALGIPESGGKTPDFLAEVRWNLNWMLSMQDADGGVWHKQTSEQFCGFVMPQSDTSTSYVIGTGSTPYKSTGATVGLAAAAAIAARCYGPYDAAFAQRCLSAARKAWTWALSHPAVLFRNPPGVSTGGYEQNDVTDDTLWAAAELYRTTGESQYEQAFGAVVSTRLGNLALTPPGWGNVFSMACWAYAYSGHNADSQLTDAIVKATVETADALVRTAQGNGYGQTLAAAAYNWGSNGEAANQSLLLLVAYQLASNPAYKAAALANLDYLLGRNCFGVSWVTQLGSNPFQHPHHRPSAADGLPAPWPGLLSGGPNAHPADPAANALGQRPPMRMWIDDQGAYSVNEVAINWNAPLVFLLAAVQS
ncbi:glycoside hydrolase family 9 protein [Silvibacterium dinghuense]|uniref:Endoglucanase n=1 Tax=Silvibacterium dinghuense TaxID=1560006 RepID=A0A4V1NUY1_9BACT|nr:glycoside hydrolase family 9 protein [Silvibacterium dinghuense]RXS93834.1 glycosyl hydrolase family 5 [Silvibacterium dinghuense]GGH08099.1 endoglucanase [Silvibacterium dinghuense]